MMDRKQRLVEVFRDTQSFYETNPALAAAVDASMKGTRLYEAGAVPASAGKTKAGQVTVSRKKTFEAAMCLARQHPGKKIAVLNFASATEAGGGVERGSSAQEESLCRCSTLFPTLDQDFLWKKFYDVNWEARDMLHTDACIYSPGVVIFKTDSDFPVRMPQQNWCTVDVISCAAPNLRNMSADKYDPVTGGLVSILPADLQRLHERRARQILAVAAAHDADILVLGAFGCGAFCNDPKAVARAYANVLKDMKSRFDLVEFAIYCRGYETANYDAFKNALCAK